MFWLAIGVIFVAILYVVFVYLVFASEDADREAEDEYWAYWARKVQDEEECGNVFPSEKHPNIEALRRD